MSIYNSIMMKEWTGDNTDMFAVMSRQEVRNFDTQAIERFHIPGVVLMENAGRNCANLIMQQLAEIGRFRVGVFCGAGNNGGDGFVIARHLFNHGIESRIALCTQPDKLRGDAKINFDICRAMNIPIEKVDINTSDIGPKVRSYISQCDLLVDALLGTGLSGELKSPMAILISCINASGCPIIAVDIPSGLDCDTGLPLPVCIEAQATVTFVAIKAGFIKCPQSRTATGRVFVADIGIIPPGTAQ